VASRFDDISQGISSFVARCASGPREVLFESWIHSVSDVIDPAVQISQYVLQDGEH
jgi:hypothetical protein